jgi:hypothetical protein
MFENEAFIKDLSRIDPLGLIISTHLHLEASLKGFICAAYKSKKIPEKNLEKEHLWRLVELAISLGLSKDVQKPLGGINKIRHRFSHQLNAQLHQQEVTDIRNLLSGSIIDGLVHSLEKGTKGKNRFEELTAVDQYILILVSLRQFIEAEIINSFESKQGLRD